MSSRRAEFSPPLFFAPVCIRRVSPDCIEAQRPHFSARMNSDPGRCPVYILVAIQLEARDLVAHLGRVYSDCGQRVPMLIPRPGKSKWALHPA